MRAAAKFIAPRLLGLIAGLGLMVAAVSAQQIGEVSYSRGAFTARQGEGEVRFLGKGMPVERNDVLTTGRNGFAVLTMIDDGRMTLRPDTAFALEQYAEQSDSGQEQSVVLRLFRGGLRSLTGLISRGRPTAYRLNTPAATIGIRGTEFDVRLCEQDCDAEERSHADQPRTPNADTVAGRVVLARGENVITGQEGQTRPLNNGAAVYAGDTLDTGAEGIAVVVFRDDTRIVLHRNTQFVVDDYNYRRDAPAESDSALFRLVRGGVRALTGLVGSRNRTAFRVSTPAATIGIRGTGFDLYVAEHCAEGREAANVAPEAAEGEAEACVYVNVWDGGVDAQQGTDSTTVESGRTAFVADEETGPVLLAATPQFITDDDAPRPDTLNPNLEDLFGVDTGDTIEPGMYVNVVDGNVYIEAPGGQIVELGRGQTGYLNPTTNQVTLLNDTPLFFIEDPYPLPSQFDDSVGRAFDLLGDNFSNLGDINNASTLQCTIQ